MIGRVVSTKLKNTATILVERMAKHPLYKKTYIQSKKYLVDDRTGVKLGDIVEFVNCKPVSKNKHWRITEILGKNFAEIAKGELKKEAESLISEVMPVSPDASQGGSEEKASEQGTGDSAQPEETKEKLSKRVKKGVK